MNKLIVESKNDKIFVEKILKILNLQNIEVSEPICLIDECIKKNIKVIVVGKNKGWKQEINNGAKNNRDFYNFPHARFIEVLKYKGLLKDIVVIEVEESYTSKRSFIDNEELRVYQDKRSKDLDNSEERNLTQGNKNQLSKDVSKSTVENNEIKLLGKRVNRKFITKDKVIIHADVNGSFNIVRKVLLNFSYKEEIINLSYELMEISNHKSGKLFNFYKIKEIIDTVKKMKIIAEGYQTDKIVVIGTTAVRKAKNNYYLQLSTIHS